jgi:hypothetical protein
MKGAAYESMTPAKLAGLILAAEKEARAVQSKLALMRRAQKRYLRALRDAQKSG